MTDQEKEVLDLTTELWNKFSKLPIQHPADQDEFCKALHICQHLVMIRETRVNHPDMFYIEPEEKIEINLTQEEIMQAANGDGNIIKEVYVKKS